MLTRFKNGFAGGVNNKMDIIKVITITGFVIGLVIQIITVGIFIGIYKTTISFMQQQIEDLKSDMRKYNNVLERLIKVESSSSSAHHRIDEIVRG